MALERVAVFGDDAAVSRFMLRLGDSSSRVRAAAALALARLAAPVAAAVPVGGVTEVPNEEQGSAPTLYATAAASERVLEALCSLVADLDW